MGFIITYITINLRPWIKGLIVAELSVIPFAFEYDINVVILIFAMSAILGSLIGFLSDKYAKQ
jgi:hypothetical protein